MVTSSRATRMLISRFSRRRIGSPPVIGTVIAPASTSPLTARVVSASSARSGGRRLDSFLVAIQVFPAEELPARVGRAAFPCPVERRRDRRTAADRAPRPSVGRTELDREDHLRGGRRRKQ